MAPLLVVHGKINWSISYFFREFPWIFPSTTLWISGSGEYASIVNGKTEVFHISSVAFITILYFHGVVNSPIIKSVSDIWNHDPDDTKSSS